MNKQEALEIIKQRIYKITCDDENVENTLEALDIISECVEDSIVKDQMKTLSANRDIVESINNVNETLKAIGNKFVLIEKRKNQRL